MKLHKPQFSPEEKRNRLMLSAGILITGSVMMAFFDDWSLLVALISVSTYPFLIGLFRSARPESVRNILYLLEVRGEHLRVGMEQIELAKLKRVAIGPFDQEHAVLQFPFNPYFQVALSFPLEQLEAARAWFKCELPNVQLVE